MFNSSYKILKSSKNQSALNIELLYDSLNKNPHDPDLWKILLYHERDEARLMSFFEKNPPTDDNLYVTQLWQINYYWKRNQTEKVKEIFDNLKCDPSNLSPPIMLARKSTFDFYKSLGYNEENTYLKFTNSTNLIVEPLSSNFFRELSRTVCAQILPLNDALPDSASQKRDSQKISGLDRDQIIYNWFLIRNSMKENYVDAGTQRVFLEFEYRDLRALDENMEYGDTGKTISEVMKDLLPQIKEAEKKMDLVTILDFSNFEQYKEYCDLLLKYDDAVELENNILEFIKKHSNK